ncbi:hypothetical protein OEA41_001491 [Lepraria neglecta]|uniref:Elongin-C n=1 Tax=Lepraria neglecta TaxID=209136 RepID=A0AAD9ZCH3_9LECA|nr:hypothetical protein OEA41_001491 [Lepraria neglecta]
MNTPSTSPYVTLISSDGFEFIVSRDAACVAGTIKKMLDPQSAGVVLEKVCEYLYYNLKHKDAKDVPDMEIPPELCLELLMAADYLHV